ncbi:MAG: helix-turn-helix domain-containing protein [Arcicella sp.]|jgi:AraC-like DNA-binding protein|nr:helix-turn-helix domain-containing protein [Arcicella sp.]
MLSQSIIFSGAILGLFLILLIQSKIEKSKADTWLMLSLGMSACLLLFYYDNLSSQPILPKFIQFFGFSLPLLSSPILYFYIKTLSLGSEPLSKKRLLHFIPFLVVFLIFISNHQSIFIAKGYPHYHALTSNFVIYFTTFSLAIVSGVYSILSLKILYKYQKSLPHTHSFTEEITLNWLKWIVLVNLFMFLILFCIIKFGVNIGLLTYENLFDVVGTILSLYVLFLGYFGFKQTTFFTNFNYNSGIEESSKAIYRNSGLNGTNIEQIFEKLEIHLEQNKPYLDENLNLFTLAQQIQVTSNQLSQVINQKTSSNFFNYINRYRIEAVKTMLKDPVFAHYSILGVGFECGFRSKSSFNKIFKDLEGITPSEYQKNQLK